MTSILHAWQLPARYARATVLPDKAGHRMMWELWGREIEALEERVRHRRVSEAVQEAVDAALRGAAAGGSAVVQTIPCDA